MSSEVAGWQPLAEWVGPADLLVDWSRVAVAPEDKGWLYLVIHSSPQTPFHIRSNTLVLSAWPPIIPPGQASWLEL